MKKRLLLLLCLLVATVTGAWAEMKSESFNTTTYNTTIYIGQNFIIKGEYCSSLSGELMIDYKDGITIHSLNNDAIDHVDIEFNNERNYEFEEDIFYVSKGTVSLIGNSKISVTSVNDTKLTFEIDEYYRWDIYDLKVKNITVYWNFDPNWVPLEEDYYSDYGSGPHFDYNYNSGFDLKIQAKNNEIIDHVILSCARYVDDASSSHGDVLIIDKDGYSDIIVMHVNTSQVSISSTDYVDDVKVYFNYGYREYIAPNGNTLKGALEGKYGYSIADNATVTLDGVTINGSSDYGFAGLTCKGNATIILKGTNSVRGNGDYPGIYVPEGKTLTIQGSGSLSASAGEGSENAAGIGGGKSSCGNIVIKGGTITATGGSGAAGIGGGNNSKCGNITITNGVTKVTATKGKDASFSIGAGKSGSCGTVTLGCTLDDDGNPVGGATGSISTSPCIYDPAVNYIYTLYFDSNGGTGDAMDGMNCIYGIPKTLPVCTYTCTGREFGGWSTTPDGDVEYADGASISTPTVNNGSVTLYANWTVLKLANNADNSAKISAANGQKRDVTLIGNTFYLDGSWNTLCLPFDLDDFTGTPFEEATVKTLASSAFSDGKLTMNFSDNLTSIKAGKPYIVKWTTDLLGAAPIFLPEADLIIRSEADWNAFAANVNSGTESYEGKVVLLAADITVSTMVGNSSDHPFKGTFEGYGHALTLNISASESIAGPFRYVDGATIQNLYIGGTLTNSMMDNGGLVGRTYGSVTISSCVVSASINCNSGYNFCNGGFISEIQSGSVTFNNCAFTGKLLGELTYYDGNNGGFVGWRNGTNIPIAFNNCLFAPSQITMESNGSSGTFNRGGTDNNTYNNSYYVTSFGEAQGTQTSATGSDLQALLGDGWGVSGDNVLPKIQTFIMNPAFADVTISDAINNVETTYADFIGSYAPITSSNCLLLDEHNPDGDAMHGALSISEPTTGSTPFDYWCTDAALTTRATAIPFADDGSVTLYVKWKPVVYTITYDLGGGSVATENPTSYTCESDDITLVNPTREGYNFDGWIGTDLTEPTMTVIIPAGSTGDREYTATWRRVLSTDYLAYNTETGKFETRTVDAIPVGLLLGTTMEAGWYVVNEDVAISSRIEVSGTVNLILCDGKTLTASEGFSLPSGATINIYGQSGGTGKLSAQVNGNAAIGDNDGTNGNMTIHGGTVQAVSSYSSVNGFAYAINANNLTINGGSVSVTGTAQIGGGIFTNGDITINGGSVSVTTGTGGIVAMGINTNGNVTINGGKVSVSGTGSFPIGINATSGKTITLGWSNSNDFIYVSTYSETDGLSIKIKDGQAMWDGTNALRGTIDKSNNLNGKTLLPSVDIAMNSAGIMTYSSKWPLDFTQMMKEDGTEVTAYIISGYNPEAHSIVLTPVTDIPGNTGLLLKGTANTVVNIPIKKTYMVYANLLVAVTSAETIVPKTYEGYTNYILANGSYGIDWYTLTEEGSIGANKAYLQLPTNIGSEVRALKWIFDDDDPDRIGATLNDKGQKIEDEWYDLNGRKLIGKPLQPGIYVNDGRKVIIK